MDGETFVNAVNNMHVKRLSHAAVTPVMFNVCAGQVLAKPA